MKRYIVYARRKDEKVWTVWTDTNDINGIEGFGNRIRELGYEAKVRDHKIEIFERKLEQGHLLETMVAVGQTVYAVIDDDEPRIEEWVVKALHYDGEKWCAIDDEGIFYEVGSKHCIFVKLRAEKLLAELKGEPDDDTNT